MVSKAADPLGDHVTVIGWIKKASAKATPVPRQAVFALGKIDPCAGPWPFNCGAWIEVERAKQIEEPLRSYMDLRFADGLLVRTECHGRVRKEGAAPCDHAACGDGSAAFFRSPVWMCRWRARRRGACQDGAGRGA